MAECQDVTGRWGQPCPSCGVVLPKTIAQRNADRDAERDERRFRLKPEVALAFATTDAAVRNLHSRRRNRAARTGR